LKNTTVFTRRLLLLGATVLLLTAAACVGGPLEATWGQISLFGEPQNILFAYNDRIVLIDPADGSPVELRDDEGNVRVDDEGNPRVWQVTGASNTQTLFYTTPIAVEDDTLLTAAYNEKLFEVDVAAARINNPEGRTLSGHVVADPLATDDFLYVPLSEGDVEAYARPGLSLEWTFDTEHGVWAQPVLVEDVLYVTSLDHKVYAVDPQTGAEIWALDLGGAVASAPVYSDGYLYVGSFGRELFKISTGGEIVARYATDGWVWSAPVIVDGVVYAADLNGFVYALQDNGTSFEPVWAPRKVANGAIRALPIVTEDAIIVGSRDRNTYWISRSTGEEIFRREMVGEILADPVLLEPSETLNIPEPMVVVSTMAHEELLVAFSVEEGQRLWRYGR
jgi:outer membrane protein assembly factor BamB